MLVAGCIEHLDSQISLDSAQAIWRDYFVFTAVRNPWDRAVSAYKFLVGKTKGHPHCKHVGCFKQRL